MQQKFNTKVQVTKNSLACIPKAVKIFEDALAFFKGSIPDLQRKFAEIGVHISDKGLRDVASGRIKTVKPDFIMACHYVIYGGDAQKTIKALGKDYTPPGLKK